MTCCMHLKAQLCKREMKGTQEKTQRNIESDFSDIFTSSWVMFGYLSVNNSLSMVHVENFGSSKKLQNILQMC